MSRFLLDMGIAQSTGQYLRSLGHDVVHLLDEGLERMPDEGIVAKALNEQRSIVTHDLDFSRIVALSGRTVPSVITLRLSDMRPAKVNTVLTTALRGATPALEEGALITITDVGTRVRELPIDVR